MLAKEGYDKSTTYSSVYKAVFLSGVIISPRNTEGCSVASEPAVYREDTNDVHYG